MMRLLLILFLGAVIVTGTTLAQPTTPPTTPSTVPPSTTPPPTTAPADQLSSKQLDAIVQRLADSVSTLNLSGQKKTVANAILEEARTQIKDLRARFHTHQIDQSELQSEAEQILFDTRDQLAQILTKDEQQRLGDEINTRYLQKEMSKSLRTFEPSGLGEDVLAFSPDDKTLACGCMNGTVCLWDVTTGKVIRNFKASDNSALSVTFSADGNRLLTGEGSGNTGLIHIWDLATGQKLLEISTGGPVHCAIFFNHEKNIASCDINGLVQTWDAATGKSVMTMVGHTDTTYGLAVTPDDKRIISTSLDHTIRVWDVATGNQSLMIHVGGQIYGTALSPDGSKIYTSQRNRSLLVWDINTGKQLHSFKDPLQLGINCGAMQISPDGKFLLAGTYSDQMRILDASTGKQLALFPAQKDWIWSVAFSHNEHLAACGGGGEEADNGSWKAAKDDKVRLWDITPLIEEYSPGSLPSTYPSTQPTQ
jgi:WD40 repeat protein